MGNKGGRAAVRIAVIAVTIIFLAGALAYTGYSVGKSYENQYTQSEKNGEELAEHIKELMENREHLDIYLYKRANSIYFGYDSQYREYNDVLIVADNFETMYEYLLAIYLHEGTLEDTIAYKANGLTSNVRYILQKTSPEKVAEMNYSENVAEYMSNIRSDMKSFLKFYLLMTDEEIGSVGTLTDNQAGVIIEEAITNAW